MTCPADISTTYAAIWAMAALTFFRPICANPEWPARPCAAWTRFSTWPPTHGGRGYVDLHQAGPASNFFLDGLIFAEALRGKAKKVVFASSGCVYPNFLQSDIHKELYLSEDLTKGPNDADNTYGWAKLMGEFTLQAYAKEHGLGAASCR